MIGNSKKNPNTPRDGHAAEIKRLCNTAYHEVPARQRADMAVETFCKTLGNSQLQLYQLAWPTPDMETTLHAAKEFMQLDAQTTSSIRKIQPRKNDTGLVQQTVDPIHKLMSVVKDLAAEVTQKWQSTQQKDGVVNQVKLPSMCHLCS